MKVDHISFSDISGGAARAAFRLHSALRQAQVQSRMQVVKATSGDWSVSRPSGRLFLLGTVLRPQIAIAVRKLLNTKSSLPHSPALLPSTWPTRIDKSDADVAHLHWINAEMMSVEDIARISKPVVWTFHDMWAFCGAEHVSYDTRWREGYRSDNRPSGEAGFDLNRWVWNRKRKAWRKAIQVVTPSRWLADCVRQSALMRGWPVTTIPNAIDIEIWKPIDRSLARSLMDLPQEAMLVAFGAMRGGLAHHKGFDLLLSAIAHLRGQMKGLEIIIFGESRPKDVPDMGFPVHYTGHLADDLSLRVLYSAADVLLIPSRIDNLPNTGVEASACGTPVVAFDTGGLADIVRHKETGWLAKPFDTEDLATGIQWVLLDESRHRQLRMGAREHAVSQFAYPVVAAKYAELYQSVLSLSN
jgi:glycosyltransferase involved in cell wall biosynthesis